MLGLVQILAQAFLFYTEISVGANRRNILSKRNTSQKKSSRKKTNRLLRFLRRTPIWLLWFSGIVIVALYIYILYYIFVGPFSIRWRAQYGEVPEPVGFEIRGIDISHYQERIDWIQLKESEICDNPLCFVICKATEGVNLKDNFFQDNIRKARRMNIITGAYHFYIPGCNARRQAEYFIEQVKLKRGDLPPIIDVEKIGSLSDAQLQDDVLTWMQIVEKHYGVKPILYASYDFKQAHLNTPELNAYPLWVARYYQDNLNYNGQWVLWQYTDMGEIDGIQGKVDLNVFNGSMHELKVLCIK